MYKLKVRRDKLLTSTTVYKCDCCGKKFEDEDIILEYRLDHLEFRVCSDECLTKIMKKEYITERQIEVFEVPDEIKLMGEIREKIENMKPNTKIDFKENLSVHYFKVDGLREHYFVDEKIISKSYVIVQDVVMRVLKMMK